MRYLILAAALSGCAAVPPPPEPAGPCAVTEQVRMRFAGVKYAMRMRRALSHAANARVVRVLHPGDMATMDFRPDRLSVTLDDLGRIDKLSCG